MMLERLRTNWESIRRRMADAARRAGRDPADVRLVAVTKQVEAETIRALAACGATELGENYPQSLWRKAEALRDLEVTWHLIGHLQGNKARKTLPMVRMAHGVDSSKLLRTLDDLASERPDPPSVCLQVNVSGEASKHGWTPEGLLADAEAIVACRSIPVVGLMTIAAFGEPPEASRPAFDGLRTLRDHLRARTGLALPELSMGMSNDFEVAIEEGATLVRVGTVLFEGVDP